MKSITIHNIDDELEALIKEKAKKQGMSLNKTIKMLLRKSLGINPAENNNHKDYFNDLSGIWSKKDYDEFIKNTSDLSTVDIRDWK